MLLQMLEMHLQGIDKTGWIVQPENPLKLSEAIEEALYEARQNNGKKM